MAIPKRIKELTALALKDRVLTYKERKTIVQEALNSCVPIEEINNYIDTMLDNRLKSYSKEELESCPGCGHGVPLLAENCPYCGHTLEKSSSQPDVPKQFKISDSAARVIESENRRVAEDKKHNCPKCGAPYPLVSNICSYCGFVLHEVKESDLNIKRLVSNIQESISSLQMTLRPSFWLVLKYRLDILFFYFAAAFLAISALKGKDTFLCLSFFFLVVSILMLMYTKQSQKLDNGTNYSCVKSSDGLMGWIIGNFIDHVFYYLFEVGASKSPITKADEEFFVALHHYQKYQRQTDTIYGESDEAKKLLADYAAEIEGYKKNRSKNRILLALVFAVVLSIPVFVYYSLPTPADRVRSFDKENPEVMAMADFSKQINYLADSTYTISDWLTVDSTAVLDFVPLSYDIFSMADIYKMRLTNVNLVSTGVSFERSDTCFLQAALYGDDGHYVLRLGNAIVNSGKDNYHTVLNRGKGHIYVEFVSDSAFSAKKVKELADKVRYFKIVNSGSYVSK